MDFFEAQKFASQAYPGKEIQYKFSKYCARECTFYFDLPEDETQEPRIESASHYTYRKVEIYVDNEKVMTLPITSHRACFNAKESLEQLNKMKIKE